MVMVATVAFARSYTGVVIDGDDYTNVRSGPGTEYQVIGTRHYGDIVDIRDEADGWYGISYRENGNTVNGWCSKKLVDMGVAVDSSGYINAPDSNIRRGPSSSSELLGVFITREIVYVIVKYQGWYGVKRSNGQECWVYGDYISF